jgi:hypothetical protein
MRAFAQSMEAKWRLKAPEAFYSDVIADAPADDGTTKDEKPSTTDLRGRKESTHST